MTLLAEIIPVLNVAVLGWGYNSVVELLPSRPEMLWV